LVFITGASSVKQFFYPSKMVVFDSFKSKHSACMTLTSPFVLNAFLQGHLSRLCKFFTVAVCVNRSESNIPVAVPEAVEVRDVEIRRKISPWHDATALWTLWAFYRQRRFDAVVTVTPKAGLLGMLAACLAYTPVRVHWFTGQVWATRRGMMRAMLKGMDRLTAACATHVLADSPSQKEFLVCEGVVPKNKISVLGQGSISGVDTTRFRPDPEARQRIRTELQIPEVALCLIYVGRMSKDKGVSDLLAAFKQLRADFAHLHLVLVGPDEEGLLSQARIPGLHVVGYTKNAEAYMAAADIICLPSYREGFGSVLIEGAACGLPAVASRIYGITDAVKENVTGLLHPPRDTSALAKALRRLVSDDELRLQLGKNAYERAVTSFEANHVEILFSQFLDRLLEERASSSEPAAPLPQDV
jgi:glycosyltransferase involved in cell wall biosynthesis